MLHCINCHHNTDSDRVPTPPCTPGRSHDWVPQYEFTFPGPHDKYGDRCSCNKVKAGK